MWITDTCEVVLDGVLRENGFWDTTARFARGGIQLYHRSDPAVAFLDGMDSFSGQYVRVLRDDTEVHMPESMKSFEHVPLTDEHEGAPINSANARQYIRGLTKAPVTVDDSGALTVPVVLYDGVLIRDALTGNKIELSAGYNADVELKSGVHEKYGAYDAVMTRIRGNHIALTRNARAGHSFRIGDSDSMPVKKSYNGITVEFDEQGAQVFDALSSDVAKLQGDNRALSDQLRDANSRAEKLEAERDAARSEILDSAALDKIVAERAQFLRSVHSAFPNLELDGKSDAEIKRAVVNDAYESLSLDGKSEEYVAALFDAAIAKPANRRIMDHKLDDPFVLDGNDSLQYDSEKARREFIEKRSGRNN